MQRLAAGLGVVAMFLVLLTAPLFHFHERDDHGSPVSLVHAHLWEFGFEDAHEDSHHPEPEMESSQSHNQARWIDFFVCKTPAAALTLAIDFSEQLSTPVLEVREQILIALTPRAHDPPDPRVSRPRSPPSNEHA